MGKGLNKVMLIGHLGNDPDMKYTPGGAAVATFSIATNESWKNKDGTQQEKTEWHRVVAWQKLAEIVGEYAKKGNQVYIEGRLQTRSWEKDGKKQYTTEIVAQSVLLLGRKGEGNNEPPLPDESTAPPANQSDREALPF